MAAAKQAAADAGLVIDASNAEEVGVIFGSGAGGPGLMANAIETMRTRPKSVSPFFIANMLPDTASGQIAIELGAKGPNMCVVTACSTGTNNIGEAAEGIRRGDYHTAITGATETPLYEVALRGLQQHAGHGYAARGSAASDTSPAPSTAPVTGLSWAKARAPRVEDYEPAQGAGRRASTPRWATGRRATPRDHPAGRAGRGQHRARHALGPFSEGHGVPADELDLINPHGTLHAVGRPARVAGHPQRVRRPWASRSPSAAPSP
ncbi:MAG: beta-ketoacyl synthase N-terminal-like domain-containing protein [Chloroflexota bacterium]